MTTASSSFWSRQFRQWHWISSALVLALMMLFAITGFTLNHPDWFAGEPESELREVELDPDLISRLEALPSEEILPGDIGRELFEATGVDIRGKAPVNEYGEMTFTLDGPGIDAYLTADLTTGQAVYERIDNGVIAKLNDLHKGRDTGLVWGVLIDITALACVIFCISGLGLLAFNSGVRASTWPLTSLGVILPVIVYVLFVHS